MNETLKIAYERMTEAMGIRCDQTHENGVNVNGDRVKHVIETICNLDPQDIAAFINVQVISTMMHSIGEHKVVDQAFDNQELLNAQMDAARMAAMICLMIGWMARDVQSDTLEQERLRG